MGVRNAGGPFAHGLGNRVLERAGAALHRVYLGAQQAHAIDVERLPLGVLLAHEHLALHIHQRGGGCGCHAVLPCAGFCNDAGFAHFFGKQHLAEHIVNLMGTGVVHILAFEIDFRAAEVLCHTRGIVQFGWTARIVVQQTGQFGVELRIVFVMIIGFFQFDDGIHQRFRHVLPAMDAEASL